MNRTAAAVNARVDAFFNKGHQRKLKFNWTCPVCDLVRYMEPREASMCRICEVEFKAVMASEVVRKVLQA